MSGSSKPLQNTVFDVFPELSTVDVQNPSFEIDFDLWQL